MPPPVVTRIRHPLSAGAAPVWASSWGEDEYGPWAEFTVPSDPGAWVTQRLRWMPPGTFQMGASATDEDRFPDEQPSHPVEISQGYWLFDTPCTQELWFAVMGENPSHFKGEHRPVEQVSWQECQEFIEKVTGQVDGLDLSLPTEAQWEYACRAGTEGARYGPLDEVAWHDGNSGGETHDVGGKLPNTWGLYDMLGNVWEWCRDEKRDYKNEKITDPIGQTDDGSGAERVIRGGCWDYDAQFVRAAYRHAFHPGLRDYLLGFRCLSSGG